MTAQLRDLDSLLAIELSEDDPAYKAAVANVEAMEMAAATWCAFRSDLENLRLALAPGPATVGRPPAVLDDDGALLGTPKRPRWWEDAEALAEPPDVVQLSFAELAETRARVKKATALAKSWGPLTQLLWELDRRIVLIEQKCGPSLDDAQRKTLTSAKMGVSEARWELWFAADADDLERRTSKSDLAAAERDVARLSDCLLPGVVQPPTHQIRRLSPFTGDGVTSRLLAWLSGMAEVADLSAGRDPAEVIAVERVKRRLFNAIVLWLLVGALLFAGLKELYLDDAVFGTWPDYLGALLWGLGATVTVDTVSSAIDKFRAGRTRAGA
ncbi:MAG TPA: hypothetical protein VHI71_05225 [Actinomycetota bacterium]|nr:hypothetical protein [Actinomycetota bacterium]